MRDLKKLSEKVAYINQLHITELEKELQIQYLTALEDIKKQVFKAYEKYAVNDVINYKDISKYNRLLGLWKNIEDNVLDEFKTIDEYLKEVGLLQYKESFYAHKWMLEQGTGLKFSWSMPNIGVIKESLKNPMSYVSSKLNSKMLHTDFLKSIKNSITQGFIKGNSYFKMSKELEIVVGYRDKAGKILKQFAGQTYKAMRIVRTEAARASTIASLDVYDDAVKSGIDMVQVWSSLLDSRTRESHGELDGVEKGEDGWYINGYFTEGPRLSGIAEEDINCRCFIRPEIRGYSPNVRRIKDEGVVPYINYKDWKAAQDF